MRRWAHLLCALALALPVSAAAMTAVIYQPQARDVPVAAGRWPQMFAALHGMGFDTLVLQWTQYGTAFSDPAGQAWVADRIGEARKAGLAIVIGLHADPDFFSRQEQAEGALPAYLAGVRRDDVASARDWVRIVGADAISGWYLPAEIDDQRWRQPSTLKVLNDHLREEVHALRAVADKPVYASTFFSGHTAPAAYVSMLTDLAVGSGVRLWVQDGAGTGKLSPQERGLYLAPLGDCHVPVGGIVFEVFRQVGPDQSFSAQPLSGSEAGPALRQRALCGRDSVFFELRYLPVAQGLLSP